MLSAQKVVPEDTGAVIVEVRVLFARELPDAHARVNPPRVQQLVPDLRHDDQGLITGERDIALVEEVIDVRRKKQPVRTVQPLGIGRLPPRLDVARL